MDRVKDKRDLYLEVDTGYETMVTDKSHMFYARLFASICNGGALSKPGGTGQRSNIVYGM